MLDVLVPQVSLQGSCVVPFVCQRVATGMPEHVRVELEPKLRLDPCALNHAGEPCRRKGRPALRGEHEGRLGLLLALQPSQSPQFVPKNWMRARGALLDPADM